MGGALIFDAVVETVLASIMITASTGAIAAVVAVAAVHFFAVRIAGDLALFIATLAFVAVGAGGRSGVALGISTIVRCCCCGYGRLLLFIWVGDDDFGSAAGFAGGVGSC